MSIIQAAGAGEAATAFYPFEISNSLRFNRSDEAFLSLTPSGNNGGTWTYSTWVKRSRLNDTSTLLDASVNGGVFDIINFPSDNIFRYENNGSQPGLINTSAKFRDTSAWYNVIVAVDTANSTAADRIKVYINGSEITDFISRTNFDPNDVTRINSNVEHRIGQSIQGGVANLSFGGYMADINFVDGSQLGPSSFGELKENIWIPKDTSGLYASAGANSFRLQFKNSATGSASSSTVGADTSGKNNHFSSTNIATTDNTTDSPTDNHATFNPEIIMMNNASNYRAIGSFSDGNLLLTTDADNESGTVPFGASSGKYYMEFTSVNLAQRQQILVFSRDDFRGDSGAVTSSSDASGNATGSVSWTSGDVIGIAVDLDNNKVFFAKNNNYFGSSNPATNTGGDSLTKLTGVGVRQDSGSTGTAPIRFNAGQIAFTHSPPSGFKSLSTAILNSPVIDPAEGENPTEFFNTVTPYSGTSGDKAVTGVGFQPDWVWIKQTNASADHQLYDSVRGVTKLLESNKNLVESTKTEGLKSFDSDGFTHGVESAGNDNSGTHVAWNWNAGGSTVSGTATGGGGSRAFSHRASTKSGVSILAYTGDGTDGGEVPHGLSGGVDAVFVKKRTSSDLDWHCFFATGLSSESHMLQLNKNDGQSTTSFGTADLNDSGTALTLKAGGSGSRNVNESGETYVAYIFKSVEGFSKIGSYREHFVSDYDVDSPYVHTGFRPAFLIIKGIENGRDWVMYDNKRTPDDGVYLRANEPGNEQTDATNHDISFLSNGFKIRGGSGDVNTTNESYVFLCYGDQPFKFANGGTE